MQSLHEDAFAAQFYRLGFGYNDSADADIGVGSSASHPLPGRSRRNRTRKMLLWDGLILGRLTQFLLLPQADPSSRSHDAGLLVFGFL